MSKTIDDRVVQMEFDNSKFEGNVKTTMSTLEKLKQALNFKGVQDGAEKSASNISTLGSTVQTVGARFSSLEVIGITALSNITNKAINAGEQMLKSLTIEPVSSGFQEYELKMDSIRTIMASTGESLATVNSYLNELNKYSDETIYSFSDMTQNIGKFTNAGVKLDKAVLAIKGVANEAAVSGANANEASRAMYNFAQALSAGYVKLIDWKSIENANMATVEFKQELLNTAVALKTVEEQADGTYKVLTTNAAGSTMDDTISATKNFNDSLAYQWMTTEVLTNTLANYADTTTAIGAKAQKAATEVATFSKAIDTLQEAAGSGWAQTWQTIIGDREEATELFTVMVNGISDIIQKSADARNNMAEMVMNSSWEKLSKKITDTGLSLDTFQDRAAEVAKKYGIDVDRLIKRDGSFGESLKRGWLNADIFRETLLSLIDGVTGTTGAMTDAESALSKYSELVRQIIQGDFGNGADRIKALTDAGYDYAAVQALVNKVVAGGTLTIDDMTGSLLSMTDAELKTSGLTDDQVRALRALEIEAKYSNTSVSELIDNLTKPSGRELLFSTMEHSISALKKSMEAIRKAWKNVFPTKMVSQGIYNALAAVEKFSEKLDFNYSTGKKLTTAFEGLFNILDLIRMVISGGVGLGFRVLKQVMENLGINVLDLAASAGEAITKFHDWVVENSFIADGVKVVADIITDAINVVSKWIAKIKELPQTSMLVSRAMAAIQNGYATAKTFMSGAVERIGAFIDRLKAMDGISLGNIQDALEDFWTNVVGYFLNVDSIEDKIKSFWSYLQIFISNIRAGGDNAKNAIIGLKDSILQQLSAFVSSIGEKIGIAGDKLGGFGDKISEVFGKVQEFLGDIPLGNVAAFAGVAGILTIIVKIAKKIKDLASPLDLISDALDAYKTKAKAEKIQAIADVIKSIALAIAATAAAIWIVVDALKNLQDITLNSDLISKVTLVVGALGGLMAISKFTGGKANGFGILAMAVGIKIVIALLDDIMAIDVDNVKAHIDQLGIVLGMLASLLLVSNLGNWKGGVALLTMSLGLTLLLGVVKIASAMKTSTIDKGVSALWKMFSFIGVFELLSLAAKNALKAAAGVALLSVAIGMLLADIVLIGLLDERTVDYGVTVLAKLMGLVDIMMLFSSATGKGNWKSIAALAAVIATLTGALVLLSLCDPESIKPAAACLSALIGMFSLMEGASGFTKDASKGSIVIMAAVVAALGGILIAISKWSNPDALIPSAEALSLLMASLSVSLLIISNAKSVSTSALGALAGIALITGLLGLMLAGLSQITDPTTIMPLTISLAIMLGTFVAALTVLSLVGPIANKAVAGLEVLGIVVTAITAFIVLVGGINELCPDLETFLDSGITVLNKVASGIGQFVGNLISGVGIGVTDGLPAIGENIKAFTDSLVGVDSSAVDAATSIASVIVALSASSVLDGISGLLSNLTGNSEGWEDKLASFGTAFKSFADSISDIPDDTVDKAKAVIDIMTPLIEVSNEIPNSGGLLGKIVGDNDIDTFGTMMESLGGSITAFSNTIEGIDSSAADHAYYAYRVASNVIEAEKLFTGDDSDTCFFNVNLETFKNNASGLGDAITAFCDAFANLNMDDVNVVTGIINEFQNAINVVNTTTFPNGSTLTSFTTFSAALSKVAPNIVSYVNTMSGITATGVATAVSNLSKFADSAEVLAGIDSATLDSAFSSLGSLQGLDFTSGLQKSDKQFSKGINSMMNSATESISGSISKMTNAMTKVVSATAKVAQSQASKFSTIGLTYAIKMAAGLSSGRSRVSTNAGAVAASGASGANSYYYRYYSAGSNLVSGFAQGIRDSTYLSTTASKEMALKALNAAKRILKEHSPSRAMYQVGAYAGEGFANGLTAYNGISYNAGETVANQAITAMRDAVSSVNAVLASDLDNTPTIRPVMDLSDVQSGMSMIGSIFDSNGLSTYGSARGVTRMMNSRAQAVGTMDIINAVKDLKSSVVGASGNTYQINGITYDDGSNITEAVKTIVDAVTTRGRV